MRSSPRRTRSSRWEKSWTSEEPARSCTTSEPPIARFEKDGSARTKSTGCTAASCGSGFPAEDGSSIRHIPEMRLRPEGGVRVATSPGEQIRGVLPSARLGLTDYDFIVTYRRVVGAPVGASGL